MTEAAKSYGRMKTYDVPPSHAGERFEIHNHIGRPSKNTCDEEAPPWFSKHCEEMDARFKRIEDAMSANEHERKNGMDSRNFDAHDRQPRFDTLRSINNFNRGRK